MRFRQREPVSEGMGTFRVSGEGTVKVTGPEDALPSCRLRRAQGKPLTADALSDLYLQLNRDYFGEDMVSDPLIAYEWCRIPHFYYNFYVYQYATSFAAAVDIAHRILKEGAPMVERYLKFLSGGCTQDPVSLLKIAGVDLSTPDPIDRALAVFDDAVRQMEELMA